MNSYSDSGYQEAASFHNSQTVNKADSRQHPFTGSASNHVVRNSRAEGQTLVQVSQTAGTPLSRAAAVDSAYESQAN